ncbi:MULTISPECIES: SIR2 family protein [unclassified Agrobacterium]|uniref:SIR2 family protein n=1 Tax=unclassified Agrobacterium TaxID=2632611 RepID=UPI002449EEB1|nr:MULTISPECIES: SIR2 family protein [unclassified Agrobacterium]MDH0614105.1 SIR2 family protein [Agrobacterium sp. GD03872]MDH0695600.1 SIR2 family protein [Agrobacterium sp. GD03871]MDH1058502.1 SIR2 family protein [Agrobacterium sp. GD03992]MDH2209556.1 SIR2 family protein [Agrobacterium sp. GD03643]MDH2218960.1 SIR2 family protein [Agrobacterium sp. GD03638]
MMEAINDIAGGGAICFVGAGFSWGATDSKNVEVPSVGKLCDEICKFPGLEDAKGSPLTDLADYCDDKPELKEALHNLLVARLTSCTVKQFHFDVMQMPWRAVFTTNFDDVAETAMEKKRPQIITTASDARNLKAGTCPLYYLHGRARDFLEGVRDPSLVVSETNYLELKDENRNLYAALVNEVHAAKRVFFIGYSLRDAEIASRLFSIEGFKDKSIVICAPDEKKVTVSRLTKFGATYPLGVERFADLLPKRTTPPSKSDDLSLLAYVSAKKPIAAKEDVSSEDLETLLLSGKFDDAAYAAQQRNRHQRPEYCIPRSAHLSTVFDTNLKRFIVTSDLGNGKSIFLDQVAYEAQGKGYEVITVYTQLPDALSELETLLSSNNKRLYIVDGLVRYRKAVRFIGSRLPANSILICASNEMLDDISLSTVAEEMGGATREIDLNVLSSSELDDWDYLLERWGFWENRIEESKFERLDFLRNRCGAENRSIILSLFRESKLSVKIEQIVDFFVTRYPSHRKSFIAVLINALCQNHVDWLRIVDWLKIDNSELKKAVISSPVGEIMRDKKRWYEFTSTELALYILNNHDFDFDDVVGVYTKIVRETAYSSNDPRSGFDARENLKELMRYRFLTRLFNNEETGTSSINAVYHQLSTVPRIRENDQFWLQYAMARMEVDDLPKAETYLKTAIGIATKKGEAYSKRQIIDQRVRLIFRKYAATTKKIVKADIILACDDLIDLLKDKSSPMIYPLRSAKYVLAFLEEKADRLDQALVESLRSAAEELARRIPEGRLDKAQKGETEVIKKCVRSIKLILGSL